MISHYAQGEPPSFSDISGHFGLNMKAVQEHSMSSEEMHLDPSIEDLIGPYAIEYVCTIMKYNEFNWKQTRQLVVTPMRMYIIKNSKLIRRVVEIGSLQGVTINLDKPEECVIHVKQEIDIRLLTTKRKRLIDTLKILYINVCKMKNFNLPIYGVSALSLQAFSKTASDVKKGIESREPNDFTRMEEEDIIKMDLNKAICGLSEEEDSGLDIFPMTFHEEEKMADYKVNFIDIQEFGSEIQRYQGLKGDITVDEVPGNIPEVGSKLKLTSNEKKERQEQKLLLKSVSGMVSDESEESNIIRDISLEEEKSNQLYVEVNSSAEIEKKEGKSITDLVTLEDFKILHFLNKGAFGSVFLAYLPLTDKHYAIKCIQTDNLKEKEFLTKINLEKMIMLEVDHPFIVQMQFVFHKKGRVYFVMDYLNGRELYYHIQVTNRFNENQVRFIAA